MVQVVSGQPSSSDSDPPFAFFVVKKLLTAKYAKKKPAKKIGSQYPSNQNEIVTAIPSPGYERSYT